MLDARRRSGRRAQEQSAAAAGRRDRRGDPVPRLAARQQFHLPRRARLRARRATSSSRLSRAALGILRQPRYAGAAARQRAAGVHAGDHRVPERAEAADHHQGERALARAPARPSWIISASSASTPTASSPANSASSACSPRPPIRARRAASPICAARSTPCVAPRRLRPGRAIPARRWPTCWRHYPRDELFQIDEDTLYHFALAILQLDERPRVRVLARRDRFDRFVSVIVFVPRDRYDSACARQIGAYLAAPSTAASRPSIRSSRKGRWCACISSSAATAATTPDSDRADARGGGRGDRAHLDRRARRRRSRAASRADTGAQLLERYRDAFSDGYREAYAPPAARRRHPLIEGLSAERAARRRFLSPREDEGSARRPEGLELRPADPAVRARAGAGEHGFPRRRRAHLRDRAARARRQVWLHDMLLERADGGAIDLEARRRALEAAFLMVMRGRRRERRLQRAGARRRA